MAYYYFDSDDHVANLHNSDVYLLANVGNYHDNNGEAPDPDFGGFRLAGDKTFTVGGNYKDDGLYNIYQKNDVYTGILITGISENPLLENVRLAAVYFKGNGEFVIASQIGAPDASKLDDRNIKIHSELFTANGIDLVTDLSEWSDPITDFSEPDKIKEPSSVGYNPYYNTSGQMSHVSGIYTDNGSLTVSGHFNGTITVNGAHNAHGMLNEKRDAVINVVVNTNSTAAGFRSDADMTFKKNFYGNIAVTQRTHLQTINRILTGNLAGAYGVKAGGTVTLDNVWAGGIKTSADKSFFDATIGVDAKGESAASNGNLSNNTVESIGIDAKNIYINYLDASENATHASTTTIGLDEKTLIHAQANGNVFRVDGTASPASNTMTNNTIQAIGIDADENLEIRNFTAGSVIEVQAQNNKMDTKLKSNTTSIYNNTTDVIGIRGKNVNLGAFEGTIDVLAENNSMPVDINPCDNHMTVAGIRANNLNADRNLGGEINISASYNDPFDGPASYTHYFNLSRIHGIYADTMTVDGIIKSNINIEARENATYSRNTVAGIYTNMLKADGFSGSITVSADNGAASFGIFAGTFDSEIGYYYNFKGEDPGEDLGTNVGENKIAVAMDTFNIEGDIIITNNTLIDDSNYTYATGFASQKFAIATSAAANLYLNGTVFAANQADLYASLGGLSVVNDYRDVEQLYQNASAYVSLADTYLGSYSIMMSYAVQTDFGKSVSSGFSNDILQLGDNAVVYGIIDLGGGTNNITFNDDSRYFGYINHNVGKTNITYSIIGEQNNDNRAIHTVMSECDATLSSGTTITVDCNNIIIGEEYKLIEYVGDSAALAKKHWETGAITISYMGESRMVYMSNNTGAIKIPGTNGDFFVQVNYDTAKNTLTLNAQAANGAAAVKQTSSIAVATITTSLEQALDENGTPAVDEDGNPVYVEKETVNFNNANLTQAVISEIETAFNNYMTSYKGEDFENVTYNRDEESAISTGNTTIYWACKEDDYRNSAYEVIYDIIDKNGDVVSSSLLRLNTVDESKSAIEGTISIAGYKNQPTSGRIVLVNKDGMTAAEWAKISTEVFEGAYYIISYDISSIPNGCTVNYKIRDYYGDGFETSPWVAGSVKPQEQAFESKVDIINNKSMVAVNPDNNTRSISSAIALLTWGEPESNFAIDKYNVQYFSSSVDLSEDSATREAIFEAYANADSSIKDVWQDVDNSNLKICFFSNGEIQLREEKETLGSITTYNYYNFTSKNVSSNELLVSGLANQTYVYWKVNATDIKGVSSEYQEGGDFRIFLGDTEGPAFTDPVNKDNLTVDREYVYDAKTHQFTITDLSWGGVQAEDEKSGVRYYIIEASLKDRNQWKEVYFINSYEITSNPDASFTFEIDPGIYDIRIRPVDAAGNYGTPSDKIVIYANDTMAPVVTEMQKSSAIHTIGIGDLAVNVGKYFSCTFSKAEDLLITDEKTGLVVNQATGVKEYKYELYYTDSEGNRVNIDYVVDDSKTDSITFSSEDALLYYEIDEENNAIAVDKFGNNIILDRKYFVKITVTDNIGNETVIIDEEINVNPESGTSGGDVSFVGNFTKLDAVTINATHELLNPLPDNSSQEGSASANPGSGSNSGSAGEGYKEEYGPATDVTATFSWTDSFENINGVYYLLQVSDEQSFDSTKTYTIIVLPGDVDEVTAANIYNNVCKNYDNVRVCNLVNTSSNSGSNSESDSNSSASASAVNSFRESVNGGYKTTVTMTNKYPTVPIGILSNPKGTYWQVKAIDQYGNESDFSATQNFDFVSNVTGQFISETTAPLKPYNISVKVDWDNEEKKNTGNLELSFTVNNNCLLGIDYMVATFSSKNGGDSGYRTFDTVLSVSGATGNATTFTGALIFEKEFYGERLYKLLADGDYTLTVNAYNTKGQVSKSDVYTFTQDTVAPVIVETFAGEGAGKVNTTIKVAFDKPEDGDSNISATVSWPIALDINDIKGYKLQYKCQAIGTWQTATVNGSDIIEGNSCVITLFNGQKYDFKLIAIDENNNYSKEINVKNINVSYKDIDDGINSDNPDYTPFSTGPVSIYNQLIGGKDSEDNIYISTESSTYNAGQMQITVSNLQKAAGKGNAIIIDVYEDNGGDIKVGSFTYKLNSDAKTSAGFTQTLLVNPAGNKFHFVVRSADSNTIMQYDLHYNFNGFVIEESDNTPFGTASYNFVEEFTNNGTTTVLPGTYPEDAIETWSAPVSQKGFVERVGYGDASNYTHVRVDQDGVYSLNVAKNSTDALSALKVTVYSITPGATALKQVKSMTVAANKLDNTLKDLNLTAGDYYIQVTSTSAQKGANVYYETTLEVQSDKYFSLADNTDNSFLSANSATTNEYVGIADAVDFKKLTVAQAGEYNITFDKASYFDSYLDEQVYGINGAVTVTIYKLDNGKTALTKVKNISVAANKLDGVISTFLDKGEYYVEVKANAPTKSAIYYNISADGQTFDAEGTKSITDDMIDSKFINTVGVVYLNDESAEKAKSTYEYVGFGEAKNYFEVTFEKDGNYTFTLNRDQETAGKDYSALKAVIYKANANGNGYTAVKTISLSNSGLSSYVTLNNLAAGQYFIEVVASDAAKGKYANYNISVNAHTIYNTSSSSNYANSDYMNAIDAVSGINGDTINADEPVRYFKLDTGNVAGMYNFVFDSNAAYTLYELKEGTVNLTKVAIAKDQTAYLDANKTYYISANTANKVPGDTFEFEVSADADLAKDISAYTADNNFASLAPEYGISLDVATPTTADGEFESWVGFGDAESWRKLSLDAAGSFNLTLEKLNEMSASALTVTIYQCNGTALKAVGNFSVKATDALGMKNFILNSGDYYIQVKNTTAKGSVGFELTIDGDNANDDKCFIAKADNSDDTAASAVTVDVSAGESIADGWVGLSDEYDYFQVTVDDADSKYYNINFANSDAAQLTLYVVNPSTGKLSVVATYNAKTAGNYEFNCLLNSNSQYIAMVKSTNAAKGGNCDYSFSATEDPEKYTARFSIGADEVGKYTFNDDAFSGEFVLEKYNSATGKTSVVKLDKNDMANLTAGDYFLTSTELIQIDSQDNINKLITIA